MAARKAKACDCVSKMQEALKEKNTRLVVGILNPRIAVVATEKINTGRGMRMTYVVATFCPFCGVKYPPLG